MTTSESIQHPAAMSSTQSTPTLEQQRAMSRRAGWFWGTLVVGLLLTQVVVGIGSVFIAIGDPSVAVVPDYHKKALAWDDERASRAASAQLGWEIDVSVSEGADQAGNRTAVVTIKDADGRPISLADVDARVYHHARAASPQLVKLRSHGEGNYTAVLQMQRAGLWQFEITATRSQGIQVDSNGQAIANADETPRPESADRFAASMTVEVESDAEPVK